MLWRALQSYGGKLPDDHVITFANTGKEREETLRFVYECGQRWGVEIIWLQRHDESFEVVGLNSAARDGEPFHNLITKYGYVPHRGAPYCSTELKTRVMKRYALSLGWTHWKNLVGIRRDEGKRHDRMMASAGRERWTTVHPLYEAGVTNEAVLVFWSEQDFDLGLLGYEGNCTLCWKKGPRKRRRIIRDGLPDLQWWVSEEARTASSFQPNERVLDVVAEVAASPMLPMFDIDEEHDAECGTWCEAA